MTATLPPENPADIPAVLPVPTERIPVAFEGEGSGTAPMTWGQTEIWLTMAQKGWIGLGGTLPLDSGTTVEAVAEELGAIPSSRSTCMSTAPPMPRC